MNAMSRGKHRSMLSLESARNEKFLECLDDGYTAEEANQIASAYYIVATHMLAKEQSGMSAARQTTTDAERGLAETQSLSLKEGRGEERRKTT